MKLWSANSLAVAIILLASLQHSDAWDPLDPNGNITIKWDVVEWIPGSGYRAIVTMYNWQLYRHIDAPGWIMGWHWGKKENIANIIGGETREQGDCSKILGPIPHCCKPNPEVIDLLPGVPFNQQTANCCRGGVLSSYAQDPVNSVASFQVIVGNSGFTNTTVILPKNFTLMTPGPGYTCGPAVKVPKTKFFTPDGRRVTLAFNCDNACNGTPNFKCILVTWNVTCTYSQHLAQKAPTCCVSFSAFYNSTIVPCTECACACASASNGTAPTLTSNGADTSTQQCINRNDPHLPLTLPSQSNPNPGLPPTPDMLYCSRDMCPVKIHWHVKINYQEYWRSKITITNRDVTRNYTLWNLVVQHPNFNNFTESFSFSYKPLNPYGPASNDSAVFWGVKFYNDMLMQAGPDGNVQSEILFRKDASFKLNNGWAFPTRVLFNGDDCVLPSQDQYPSLPSSSSNFRVGTRMLIIVVLSAVVILLQ